MPSFQDKLQNYIKASYSYLWVQTHEEKRICDDIFKTYLEFKNMSTTTVYEWDCNNKLQIRVPIKDSSSGKYNGDSRYNKDTKATGELKTILDDIVKLCTDSSNRLIFILKDFHPYIEVPGMIRGLRNAIETLKARGNIVIFTSPIVKIPTELAKDIQLVDFTLPDEEAIRGQLGVVQRSINTKQKGAAFTIDPDIEANAVEAAKGMTASEVQNAFTLALVENLSFNKGFVTTVFDEKIQQLKKSSLLTYIKPDVGFSQVGGLASLKTWMQVRAKSFTAEARKYGLPYSKGVLLCGVMGCGKSLIAKAVANEFNFPLFQLDVGSLFGSHVGDTEQNFRTVIQTVESIGRCVLYIDEIEKALNKDAVSGKGDTGTSSRSFGTLLTWLSDHKSPVFVIGTSNNFTILPPEFIRKGRFDELFWIDLPDQQEREDIFRVMFVRYKRDNLKMDIKQLATLAEGFTGSEIENVVVTAMFNSFAEAGKEITMKSLEKAIVETVPISKTCANDLALMRASAEGKLRPVAEVKEKVQEPRVERNITL